MVTPRDGIRPDPSWWDHPDLGPNRPTTSDEQLARAIAALHDRRPSWWSEAACLGSGIDAFYSDKADDIAEALQTCGRCPALLPCRQEAVSDPRLDHGIRGGMNVSARKAARRARKAGT